MAGIGRGVVIGFMAGNTFRARVRIIPPRMAFGAIGNFMPFGEREKVVVYLTGVPVKACDVVAIYAIGRKSGVFVVRIGRRRVIARMAIDTRIPDPVKLKRRFGLVTIGAVGQGVRAQQGEAVVLVQFGNVVHQPVVGGVAAGAIRPDRSLVHVRMTGNTAGFGIGENKGFVAGPAIDPGVLPLEWKIGFIVIKPHRIPADTPARNTRKHGAIPVPGVVRDLPPRRGVAGGAIDLKIGPVRRLGKRSGRQH